MTPYLETGCVEETGDEARRNVRLADDVYMPAAPAWASAQVGKERAGLSC
jgi:hypothetical protein